MGKIFAQLGHHYSWASPTYLLNEMSIDQIFMYYDYMAEQLTGKPAGENKNKPDREKFHELYGDKIKTPSEMTRGGG